MNPVRVALVALSCIAIALTGLPPAAASTPGAPAFNAVAVPAASTTSLELQFGSVSGATSYSYIMNGAAPVSMGLTQPFTVTGLTAGSLYCFELTATTAGGTSTPSEVKCGVPGALQDPVSRLVINSITSPSPGVLAIDYTRPSDPAGMDAINVRVNGQFFAWAYDLRSPLLVSGFTPGASVTVQIKGGMPGYMPDSLFSDPYAATVGSGAPAAPVIVAPGAPTITVLERRATSLRFRVDAPSRDGGQSPFVYEAGVQDGSMSTFHPADRDRVVEGLEPGRTYVVVARARNDAGWGPDGYATATTDVAPPSPPVGVEAFGGVRSATVTWQPPRIIGGSPVTAYLVRVGDREVRFGPESRVGVIEALPSWSDLPVSVRAVSDVGVGEPSTLSVRTLSSATTAVRNLQAETVGRGRVRLSWDPPVDPGDPSLGPLEYLPLLDDATPVCRASVTTTSSSCIATGLRERVPLDISVGVVGGDGRVLADTRASIRHTIRPTAPGAPLRLESTVGTEGVSLTWLPPLTADQTGVDSYVVRATLASEDAGARLARACEVQAPARGCLLLLPVRGVYLFSVAAVNDEGQGSWSATREVRVSEVPTAEVTVTGIEPRQARLEIATPPDRGLPPELEYAYVVTASDGRTISEGRVAPGRTAVALTGLRPGSSGSVRVRAVSPLGAGPVEQRWFSTPTDLPGAPVLSASVTPVNEVRVAVDVVDDGGDAGATVDVDIADVDGIGVWNQQNFPTGQPTLIGGLAPGRVYTVRAVAVNSAGAIIASSTTVETAAVAAGMPTSVMALPGPKSITLTWEPPADDGGRPVVGYSVTVDGGQGMVQCPADDAGLRRCVIRDLSPDARVGVSVAARTAVGLGAAARVEGIPAPTVPKAPAVMVRQVNDRTINVVVESLDTGGRPVTGTDLVVTDRTTGTALTPVPRLTGPNSSVTISGLVGATDYEVRVRLANEVGWGEYSVRRFTTEPGAPGAPVDVRLTPAPRGLAVQWTPPARDGGRGVTEYVATAEPGGATCRTAGAKACTITGLNPRTDYRVSVTAANTLGRGPASATATRRPGSGAPGAPGLSLARRTGTTTTLAIAPPGDDGGEQELVYDIDIRMAGSAAVVASRSGVKEREITFSDLRAGEAYVATARARSAVGAGPEGRLDFLATAAPAVPTLVGAEVQAMNEPPQIRVTFEPPSTPGEPGTYVTRYEVLDWNGTVVASQASQRPVSVANSRTIEMLFSHGKNPAQRPPGERTYGLRAVNNLGYASATVPFSVLAPWRPDMSVAGVGGTPDAPSVTLTWTPPISSGGSAVTSVTALVRGKDLPRMSLHYNSAEWKTGWYSCTAPAAAGTCTISGLAPGLVYVARAYAENSFGRSAMSDWPGTYVGFTNPTVPRNPRWEWVVRDGGKRNLFLMFDPPVFDGRADVMFYEVREAGSGRTLARLNLNHTGGHIFEFELKPGDSRRLEIIGENNARLKSPPLAFTVTG